MIKREHQFHIPVMGTGHSIDSPIRVAHLGIESVISVVDDMLCEKIRKHYCNEFNFTFKNILRLEEDGRAKRITAYLDMVGDIVSQKFEDMKALPLFSEGEKDRYFKLLPSDNPLRKRYDELLSLSEEDESNRLKEELTDSMKCGSIDVNIMAKVDALGLDDEGKPLSSEYSDASAALRGFANSKIRSGLVLSAGFNPRLYSYLSEFKDFYRDAAGDIKKKIILKVSDFRSAMIQGKFLAKKGLEVAEFRIESGLNCGGHAFASDGQLMPVLLQEFREKRDQLVETFQPMVKAFYESQGWDYPELKEDQIKPIVTVQGGIGNNGEMQRLLEDFDMDGTGWGSPFLLVPEATCVDSETSKLLADAGEDELYLSNVSPLGVPFNNIRGSGSEIYTKEMVERGKPGSKCPKKFLVTNTEFTENPICTASTQYQLLKINQIERSELSDKEKSSRKEKVVQKTCLCTNLGAGSLIRLGIMNPPYARQSICPGPNMAWFTREYSIEEMADHIYGRRESIVSEDRPHMFAKELAMYVDYIEELAVQEEDRESGAWKKLVRMKKNLEKGIKFCEEIAARSPFKSENLDSLKKTANVQRKRLLNIFDEKTILA